MRECATGKNPFEGNNFAQVVGLIANARYTPISEVNPRLSKRFAAIVERAMSLDPANRFEDMRAMGRQLLMLAGQRTRITWGLTFGPEGRGSVALATLERNRMPQSSPDLPPFQQKRRKRTPWLLLLGVAVFSAGVTSLFVSSPREPAEAGRAAAHPEAQQPV